MYSIMIEIYSFIAMFLFGLVLAFCLNIYIKITANMKSFFVKLIDLIFGLAAGVIAFYILLFINWGQFRFYIILAILMGSTLYLMINQKLNFIK